MANNIKRCRYAKCDCNGGDIDITKDEYVNSGKNYFHKACYEAKIKAGVKDEKTKKDLQYIKTLWINNINKTVVFSRLFQVLNDYIDKGVDSDYLVFAVQYCIEKRFKLNYPDGLKYYVDMQEVKDAYTKSKIAKLNIQPNTFEIKGTDTEDIAPKFVSSSTKRKGFSGIFD